MLELIVKLCLLTDTSVCKDVKIPVYETERRECLMNNELRVNNEVKNNWPGWFIRNWDCVQKQSKS